jgi:hypothetical protein
MPGTEAKPFTLHSRGVLLSPVAFITLINILLYRHVFIESRDRDIL